MGISIWQLLIVLLIIVLLFGTKKLRNIGGDLGSAIKNFRSSMKENEDETVNADEKQKLSQDKKSETVIDAEIVEKTDSHKQ